MLAPVAPGAAWPLEVGALKGADNVAVVPQQPIFYTTQLESGGRTYVYEIKFLCTHKKRRINQTGRTHENAKAGTVIDGG